MQDFSERFKGYFHSEQYELLAAFQQAVVPCKMFRKIFLMAREVKKRPFAFPKNRLFLYEEPYHTADTICDTRFWHVRNLAEN